MREESASPSASRTVGAATMRVGKIEVARQLRDHLELLKVLLAEHGEVGRALDEKFGDHRRHAGKEVRPEGVFEAGLGRTFRYDLGGEPAGIHDVAASGAQTRSVPSAASAFTSAANVRG